jgi:hypothetical protein
MQLVAKGAESELTASSTSANRLAVRRCSLKIGSRFVISLDKPAFKIRQRYSDLAKSPKFDELVIMPAGVVRQGSWLVTEFRVGGV